MEDEASRLDGLIRGWCAARLGSEAREVLFRSGHIATVIGYRLADGREVVVKTRAVSERAVECVKVQQLVAERGFPCPRPLAGVDLVDGLAVHAEEYRSGGGQLPRGPRQAALSAKALARLVSSLPAAEEYPALAEPLAWVGWNHGGEGSWPRPDDLEVDLNHLPGPAWLDGLASALRARLKCAEGTAVIGHGDWESQNLRWIGSDLYCAHDWDSLVSLPEPALAGAAAAVFTISGAAGTAASLDESERFLEAYAHARGVGWAAHEVAVAWAAGLWVRLYNAKKEWVRGGGAAVERERGELEARFARVNDIDAGNVCS